MPTLHFGFNSPAVISPPKRSTHPITLSAISLTSLPPNGRAGFQRPTATGVFTTPAPMCVPARCVTPVRRIAKITAISGTVTAPLCTQRSVAGVVATRLPSTTSPRPRESTIGRRLRSRASLIRRLGISRSGVAFGVADQSSIVVDSRNCQGRVKEWSLADQGRSELHNHRLHCRVSTVCLCCVACQGDGTT